MLVIATPMGNLMRSSADIIAEDERSVRLRPCASCCLLPANEPLPRSSVSVAMYSSADLPDPARAETEISNVCGFVAGVVCVCVLLSRARPVIPFTRPGFSALNERHPAWRTVRSTLGRFREAYSLRGGNLLFLRGKLIFKGATCRQGVYETAVRLLSEPSDPVLKAYLIIATAYMRRNLFVHSGCLLEEMLSRFAWCRVMVRHEEMSNAVIFYINTWDAFPMPAGRARPDMGTVSVSRRGVINVRLGWHDGVEWTGNDEWLALVDAIREFLLTLC